MNVARSTVKLFGGLAFGSVVSFVGVALFAQTLGASVLGSFFLFQAVLAFAKLFSDLGTGAAASKRISEGGEQGRVLTTVFLLRTALLVPPLLAFVLFRGYIDAYLGASLAHLLVPALLAESYAGLFVDVLEGEKRVGETAVLNVTRQFVWVGLGLAFVALGATTAQALVVSLVVSRVLVLAWALKKRDTPFRAPSLERARSLLQFSKYSAISYVSFSLYDWIDVAIIGLFLTTFEVGYYEISWKVAVVVVLFTHATGRSIFPVISDLSERGRADEVRRVLGDAITPSLFFVIPAVFGTALFAEEILALFFGIDEPRAALVLVVLVAGMVPRAFHDVFERALLAVDRPAAVAQMATFGMVLNVGLNLVLIYTVGAIGAAVATVTAYAAVGVIAYRYLDGIVGIDVPMRELRWCLVSSLSMAAVLLVVEQVVAIRSALELAVVILFAGVLYVGIASANDTVRETIRYFALSALGSQPAQQ